MTLPLGTLEYRSAGTADFDRDCPYYRNVLGAERAWAFHADGAYALGESRQRPVE